MNLRLQNEALAVGRRAPYSIPIFLFLFLTLPSFFPPFCFSGGTDCTVLSKDRFVVGFRWEKNGIKMRKSFCHCWFVFPDGSYLQCSFIMWLHMWALRLVHSGVWGSCNSPDTGDDPTSHVSQTQKVLPSQSLEGALVSQLFFLPPKTSYTDFIGDVYGSREQSFGAELILAETHHVVCEVLLTKGTECARDKLVIISEICLLTII